MLISQLYLYEKFCALMHNENFNDDLINSEEYYAKHARDLLKWDKESTKIYNNDIRNPEWFADGMLNACYNTIDRHAERTPDKLAIIYDDNDGKCYKYTFKQCLIEIMKVANFLQAATKSQKELAYVAIYMQTSPQLIFTALACARLGLPHNIIFGGFSAENIALRIKDSKSKIVFTNYDVERETKKIIFFDTVASAYKILQKDNYDLEYIVVYDVDNLQINPDEIPVVLWNDLLRISPNIPDETNSDPNDIVKYVTHNIVCKNTKNSKPLIDTFTDLILDKFIPCIPVHAEHPLYCLYTSGSTGKPKGLVHSTGGYLFYAAFTTKVAYNITDDSIFLSTADLGWIAGHTNSLYGTLPLGCTIVIMSGSPVYPDLNRLFRMIEQYKVTHLFTAPTVIRILQQKLTNLEVGFKNKSLLDIYKEMPTSSENFGLPATDPAREILSIKKDLPYEKFIYQDQLSDDEMLIYNPQSFYRSNKGFFANGYDLSSLKLISYAGEQLSKDTYLWWRKTFGPFIPLLTSYWQTEAGSILLSNHYNKTYPIPESTGVPFFGLEVTIASSAGINQGSILVSGSWPGVARTILNDHERYVNTYYKLHEGFYYTGDAGITKNGYFFIQGRDDDVVKVAGHRLSTSEIESACCTLSHVCEAAAIGVNDSIHGQVIAVFCVKKDYDDDCTKQDVINAIRNKIGPIVRVNEVYFVLELPKTRAGKIMRRILRNIVENNEIGDLSTCLNIECISQIYISCSTKPKRIGKCESWISI